MLNIACYSAPQLFRLPYQHMMIVEDLKNVCVFAIESQSEDESTRDRSVLHMQMDICSYFLNISCHFFNIYRYAIDCASWVLQLYASRPVIYSANKSLNAISSDHMFTVYIFAYGSKIVLYSSTWNWRDIVYLIGICRHFCVLCQCRIGIITCSLRSWQYGERKIKFWWQSRQSERQSREKYRLPEN